MINDIDPFYDLCIVGAGVAGSALALYLADKNLKIIVIEQKWEVQESIVGELLQPGGVNKLTELGLSDALSGIDAQEIDGYVLYLDQSSYKMPYPALSEGISGLGFRYKKFIENLRLKLEYSPSIDIVKARVKELTKDKNGAVTGVSLFSKESEPVKRINASLTVVSQGSTSSLRSGLSKAHQEIEGYMLGLILEDSILPQPNHGHVIMADPGPIIVYPVGHDQNRMLIDFPKSSPSMKGKELIIYLIETILPQLPNELRSPFRVAVDKGDFMTKPNCELAAKPIIEAGVVLLGDSLNQRHPVTGGGITVALTDVKSLAELLVETNDFVDKSVLTDIVGKFYYKRYKQNATINILANALYRLFKHEKLRTAFFNYVQLTDKTATEPMALLSGISQSKTLLIKHFFLVAWHGFKDSLKPFPTFAKVYNAFKLMFDALQIIRIPLVNERPSIVKDGSSKRSEVIKTS